MVLGAWLLAACTGGVPPAAPEITAQGFDITEPREGLVSEFGHVRLRLQVEGKIEELTVRQGGNTVELAKTLDLDQFRLFGLERRPYARTDVTFDLRGYINEKIMMPGEYRFEITVTDRLGQSKTENLTVIIEGEIEDEGDNEAARIDGVEERDEAIMLREFRFQRTGRGEVIGADLFGISWITIEPIEVTIRLAGDDERGVRVTRLLPDNFDRVTTRSQLDELADNRTSDDIVEFAASDDQAIGQVLLIVNDDRAYLLKAFSSETSLSHGGTTVTVAGQYKY